ncbi:MAG TPA: sugar transferase [Acidimicrobiia bacterium]|jgi:lipopolysaccharide/colanic/teichoic acid biosynthesis glycosyltransferase
MRRLSRFLVVAGTLGCVLVLSKAHAAAADYDYTSSSRFGWSIGYALTLCVAAYGFGLPDGVRSRRGALLAALGASSVALATVSMAQLLVGDALLPRAVVLGSAVILAPWYVMCWAVAGDAHTRAEDRDRVVVVCPPDDAAMLDAELRRAPERPALVVGALTPHEAHPVDPPVRPLVDAVRRHRANVIVLCRDAQGDEHVVTQAAELHSRGVRVRTLSLFYEQWLGKLPVSELERVSLLFDIGEVHTRGYVRVKRLLDIVLALCGGIALLVVTPFVLVGNVVGNRGSLLYRQQRVGRNGTTFEMVKLRTMRPAEALESDPTLVADPRVTPFGGLLRRTHLDELPQVLNMLRGELSVVGPRPEQPHLVELLEGKIPFYGTRHLVRPGLTGWAQVKYHYGADEVDALEKLQYDVFYLRRQGIGLDLRIVARTLRSVLGRDGR